MTQEEVDILIELGTELMPVNLVSLMRTMGGDQEYVEDILETHNYKLLLMTLGKIRGLALSRNNYTVYVVNYNDNKYKQVDRNDEVVIVGIYYNNILIFGNDKYIATGDRNKKATITDKEIETRIMC